MNRTEAFIRNSFATMILQVITMIAGFIIPKIMIEVYGSEINGMISSIGQFISYFSLVEAGISSAAIVALYGPIAQADYKKINGVIVAAKNFYMQSGYIFVALTALFSFLYPFFITTEALSYVEIVLLVFILGFSGAVDFFTLSKYRVFLTAAQKTYVISLASALAVIVNTTVIAVLSYYAVDVVLVRFVALSSVILRTYILYWYVHRHYQFMDFHAEPDNHALDKRWDALYLQILGPIQNGTPIVLATMLTSLKIVSAYSVYNLVVLGLTAILSVFTTGLGASFGDVIARKEQEVLKRAYNEFEICYYFLIAGMYGIAFATITPFICIYTKNATDMSYNLPLIGFLMVLNGLLYNLKTPQGMIVVNAGLFRENRNRMTLQAFNVVFWGALLGYFWGLPGIICGGIISNLVRDVDLAYDIPKHVIHISPWKTMYRMVQTCIIATVIYIPTFYIDYQFNNFFDWCIYTFVLVVYATVLIMVIWLLTERDVLKDAVNRLILSRMKRG